MIHFKASTINLGCGFKLFLTAKQKGNDSYFDLALFFFFQTGGEKNANYLGTPKKMKKWKVLSPRNTR